MPTKTKDGRPKNKTVPKKSGALKKLHEFADKNKKLLIALGLVTVFSAGTVAEIERRMRAKAKAKGLVLSKKDKNGKRVQKGPKVLVWEMAKQEGITKKKAAGVALGAAAIVGGAAASYALYKKKQKGKKKDSGVNMSEETMRFLKQGIEKNKKEVYVPNTAGAGTKSSPTIGTLVDLNNFEQVPVEGNFEQVPVEGYSGFADGHLNDIKNPVIHFYSSSSAKGKSKTPTNYPYVKYIDANTQTLKEDKSTKPK